METPFAKLTVALNCKHYNQEIKTQKCFQKKTNLFIFFLHIGLAAFKTRVHLPPQYATYLLIHR